MNKKLIIALVALMGIEGAYCDDYLHIVRERRLVPTVSSKTEHGWAHCSWCGGKIGYDRTYRWDPYTRVWNETTAEVPTTCRKCKPKEKEAERLRREEANLDRKIEVRQAKRRIAEKRARLRNWTSENR